MYLESKFDFAVPTTEKIIKKIFTDKGYLERNIHFDHHTEYDPENIIYCEYSCYLEFGHLERVHVFITTIKS